MWVPWGASAKSRSVLHGWGDSSSPSPSWDQGTGNTFLLLVQFKHHLCRDGILEVSCLSLRTLGLNLNHRNLLMLTQPRDWEDHCLVLFVHLELCAAQRVYNCYQWVSEWTRGGMDGWMVGWMDRRTNERTNKRTSTLGTITSHKNISESVIFGKQLSRLLLRALLLILILLVSIHMHITSPKSSMSEQHKPTKQYGQQRKVLQNPSGSETLCYAIRSLKEMSHTGESTRCEAGASRSYARASNYPFWNFY